MPGLTDRRLAKLLELFAKNATIVLSGARIAREIGVSRSAVWQWVQQLRELGVRVKALRGSGYFLDAVPDILTPGALRARLAGSRFGRSIYHFFRTDSANRVALDLGHAGEPEGAVVISEEQTAGRGRAGHTWHSERAAGIYATLLLRPAISPVQAPMLTMLAGLSVRAAIEAQTGLVADLKWPNDIFLNRKKAGGILTEMYAEPSQIRFVIVGIGINVNTAAFPADLAPLATSLRLETGKAHSRADLLVRLLQQFETDYNLFLRDGAAPVIARFTAASSYATGKRVSVTAGNGRFTGVTAGITDEGLLRVRRDDGETVTVIAGNVAEVR
jgi:BirA family biotin operon repressor/biotin-[acetyl-CoA-carboxylase] ligase